MKAAIGKKMETYKWASVVAVTASVAIGAGPAFAKSRHANQTSGAGQDQITIQSHIPVADGPVIRFVATERNGHSYVYAERQSGKGTTLIDVTQAAHPKILGEVTGAQAENLVTVAGTAALASSIPVAAMQTPAPAPQTMQILDLSDPANPKVVRRFEGVTAMEKLPAHGLILLANAEGVWILSEHIAKDPAVEEQYARKVVYGESRY
jgi:hypothetical protein